MPNLHFDKPMALHLFTVNVVVSAALKMCFVYGSSPQQPTCGLRGKQMPLTMLVSLCPSLHLCACCLFLMHSQAGPSWELSPLRIFSLPFTLRASSQG